MSRLQWNVLFCVGVGGVIVMLVAPSLSVGWNPPPAATAGVGAILTFVLTQKKPNGTHDDDTDKETAP